MTEEIYNKIVSEIETMSKEEYQNLLKQSKEMDRDFEKMIKEINNDSKRIN